MASWWRGSYAAKYLPRKFGAVAYTTSCKPVQGWGAGREWEERFSFLKNIDLRPCSCDFVVRRTLEVAPKVLAVPTWKCWGE